MIEEREMREKEDWGGNPKSLSIVEPFCFQVSKSPKSYEWLPKPPVISRSLSTQRMDIMNSWSKSSEMNCKRS